MTLSAIDKLFYLRAGLGVVAGLSTQVLFGADWENGVILGLVVYLLTFYGARYVLKDKLSKEDLSKMYTAGVASYAMLYLFCWFLLYTIGFHSLELVL